MATIPVPSTPDQKKEPVPILNEAVSRSLAKPDAFMKPGSIGKGRGTNETRIRMTNTKPKSGRQRKRKRDPRDVHYF
jgi:hypothetical protein